MAEVFVREAEFLGAEKKSDRTRCEALTNEACAGFEAPERVLQIAVADGGSADDERAIGNGIGHAGKNFRVLENCRGSDGGARFAKRRLVWIDDAQMSAAKIAHRARGCANVEWIARRDEDDAQAVEFAGCGHAAILCQVLRTRFPHRFVPYDRERS